MKKTIFTILSVTIILILSYHTVSALWAPATGVSPTRNVPAPLNTGDGIQVKNSALIIERTPRFSSNMSGLIGFGSESTIGVRIPSFAATNPLWIPNSQFALDTNAPIAINGGYLIQGIQATKGVTTDALYLRDLYTGAGGEAQLCANQADGTLQSCAIIASEKPTVTISATPNNISPGIPVPVSISWSSVGADLCEAVQGPGFYTGARINGTDGSNRIVVDTGDQIEFSVLCKDSLGRNVIASTLVGAGSPTASIPAITIGQRDFVGNNCTLNPVISVKGDNMYSDYPIKITYKIVQKWLHDNSEIVIENTVTLPAGQTNYDTTLYNPGSNGPVQSAYSDSYTYTVDVAVSQTASGGVKIEKSNSDSRTLQIVEANDAIC
jgi:hypothetical protein